MEKGVRWSLDDYHVLQLEENKHHKQDFFLSMSEVQFEDKWQPVEIQHNGKPFLEYRAGSPWIELPQSLDNE